MSDDPRHCCFPIFYASDNPGSNLNRVYVVFEGVEGIYVENRKCQNKGWTYQGYPSPEEGLDAWFSHCRENHYHPEPPPTPANPFTIARHTTWKSGIELRRSKRRRQPPPEPQPQPEPQPEASPQAGPGPRMQSGTEGVREAAREAGAKYRAASDSDCDNGWEDIARTAPASCSERSSRRRASPPRRAGPSSSKAKPFPQSKAHLQAEGYSVRRPHSSSPDKRASTPMRIVSRSSDSCVDSDTDTWWYCVRGDRYARSFMSSEKAEADARALRARGIDAEVTMHASLAEVQKYMKSCTL